LCTCPSRASCGCCAGTRTRIGGDEITAHYGWIGLKAAIENARHTCVCQASYCVGTIELFIEMLEDGPHVPDEEITRRLVADIVNGIEDHERLLTRYSNGVMDMVLGRAPDLSATDPLRFLQRMRTGALKAVPEALRLREAGATISDSRLRLIARHYHVPLPTLDRSPSP
jgi:hypothetical protein